MVRMSVLADCLKSIHNAEKRGKRQVRPGSALDPSRRLPVTPPRRLLQVLIRPSSKVIVKFLEVMQKHGASRFVSASLPSFLRRALEPSCVNPHLAPRSPGYIGEFEIVDDHRSGKIVVQLIGRINKCGVISPRFDLKLGDVEKWINNLLPSRQFGHIVLTTSAGIVDHEEARRKHTGGKVLGFFY